nr:hypothetical protein [Prolixibacteraceae bacterium]
TSYSKTMGNTSYDYLPVIMPITKKAAGDTLDDKRAKDQLASVFMRWVAPKEHMEVYVEFGKEDHNYDLTDLLLEPVHGYAYIIGARKLTPIGTNHSSYIDIQIEITQLEGVYSPSLRTKPSWYRHGQVRDGYTHTGQYLGAGIGMGCNMQTLNIAWVNNLRRIGLEIKRVARNEDFWALAIKDYRSHWVDVGGSVFAEWNFDRLLVDFRMETLGSINYQWLYDPVPGDPPSYWDHGKVRYNVQATLGLTYCF